MKAFAKEGGDMANERQEIWGWNDPHRWVRKQRVALVLHTKTKPTYLNAPGPECSVYKYTYRIAQGEPT